MDLGIFTEITWQMALLGALSLSLGWGIRGNFGHELGAAIPGALAAMAVVLVSGRADWWPRIAYFGMFGALGWAFGGSMSYMHVVSYTHSGHSGSVLYGFANLFVIGFLWAAMGGAGTALPAILSSEHLNLFFVPIIAIFIGWVLQNAIVRSLSRIKPMQRHRSRLYWYDTDWLNVLVATVATLIVVIVRGRFDMATSFILHLTIGWFAAFLLLVNVLKLRMTPPRGDNWSGCVGLVAGVLIFCWRHSLGDLAFVTLMTGFIGGIGYALSQLLKLVYIRTGLNTNWHSVLEQTQGFFHGIGLAVAMALLASRAPVVSDTPQLRPWTMVFAVTFILVALTYLNHRKATETWIQQVKSLPEKFYRLRVSAYRSSLPTIGWFELIYIAIGIAVVWLLVADFKQPLPFIPATWLGKGQLLYLIFMWWVVVFNFERALVGFTPQRIVTEGVIMLNAVVCTVLLALGTQAVSMRVPVSQAMPYAGWIPNTVVVGLTAMILATLAEWGITHAIYGHNHAPGAGLNIRFGPDATAIKEKPKSSQQHP
ncbi:hypothetical protein ACFL6S_17200 [Candidatus Poribacteria bacterium]